MPRPNRPRSIASESNLAERIALEREKRALSYEALAGLMTDAGCAMAGTAIFRIETGNPRRRITVDELVAFAAVFDTTVEDLLAPVEVARKERARRLVAKAFTAFDALPATVYTLAEVIAEIRELSESDPEVHEYFVHLWQSESQKLTAYPLAPLVSEKLTALVEAVVAVHSQPGAHPGKMPVGTATRRNRKHSAKERAS
jgi:transcriptional regulator with XRE-family HTH domain